MRRGTTTAIPRLVINPFRAGAGHAPPYLAGRDEEKVRFRKLLDQVPITRNLVLTGLRGVGKTVLLETFKPIAIASGWLWAGTDLSESSSISEAHLSKRILADLAPLVADLSVASEERRGIGFHARARVEEERLDYATLEAIYEETPGLAYDKLKAVLKIVWASLEEAETGKRGIVLAYDEAQNMSNQREEYPLSLLLDVTQAIQREGYPVLVLLAGLPTLYPKLVEARTYAERMFEVVTLGRLDEVSSRAALEKPIRDMRSPLAFTEAGIEAIVKYSGGYPYFLQFFGREMFDSYMQQAVGGRMNAAVTVEQTLRKLDTEFFAARWSKTTDRQRDLLRAIATLESADGEFTVQEAVAAAEKLLAKPMSGSHVNQMLSKLTDAGLIYRNRHGYYSFAVPLFAGFIRRNNPA